MQCSSTLKKTEEECYNCGSVVQKGDDPKVIFAQRFSSSINVIFIGCSAITVASLFLDFGPPFSHCASVTGVVGLVKSSAAQMLDKKSRP